jgi:hypothetical protein
MLSWIPILGPIIQGIIAIFTKSQDTSVAKAKIEADVHQSDTAASVQTLEVFKDDIGLRIARDVICFPIAVWCLLVTWDTIIAESNYSYLMFHVAGFDKTSVPYLPYAVLTFLLGNIGINAWRTK